MTNLPQDIGKSLKDFEKEWKKLAKEIRSSLEWKEMSVYSQNNKFPPTRQRTTIYKVLTLGESQHVSIGTPDVSAVEIKALFPKGSSNSKKLFSTLCLLLDNICSDGGKVNVSSILRKIRFSLEWKEMSVNSLNKSTSVNQRKTIYKVLKVGERQDVALGALDASKVEIEVHLEKTSSNSKKMFCLLDNICSEEGKVGEVNVSRILRKKSNLDNLSYITIVVTDDYETFLTQLEAKSIDFDLKLTVAGKFVAIRHYTISLTHKRNKRSSWSGFTQYSIPYESLMPD